MAKAQFPIDGKLGKDFKVTSYMGWRVHPVQHTKRFHNGTDIWSPHEPCWIEAPYDGVVVDARKSTAAGGGFGNFVILRHKINGKDYTTLYGHMKDGSLKVKKGQKVTAGTPLGKMGTTGMSTGKHLHWELHLGKSHVWSATGKGYIEPIGFFKTLIAQEKAIASAPVEAHEADPVLPTPVHNDAHATVVEAQRQADKVAAKVETPAVAPTPTPAPVVEAPAPVAPAHIANPGYPGHYVQHGAKGEAVRYIQQQLHLKVDGDFGPATDHAVKALQHKHGLTADGIVGPKTWHALG